MSDLFYDELRMTLEEELQAHEMATLRLLLEKSKHIIDKIKFKAA